MDQSGNRIVQAENLAALRAMETGSVELIYVDPPLVQGRKQSRTQMKTVRDEAGTGWVLAGGGTGRRSEKASGSGYGDRFD